MRMFQKVMAYFLMVLSLAFMMAVLILSRPAARDRSEHSRQKQIENLFRSVFLDFDNQPWNEPVRAGGRPYFRAVKTQTVYEPSFFTGINEAVRVTHVLGYGFIMEENRGGRQSAFFVTVDDAGYGMKTAMIEPVKLMGDHHPAPLAQTVMHAEAMFKRAKPEIVS